MFVCVYLCVCILAVVPVVQECGRALISVLQQIGKGHLIDRSIVKVCTVGIPLHSKQRWCYAELLSSTFPPITGLMNR